MTNISIPPVIVDTTRRNREVPPCGVYQWCELDHRDPDIDAGLHETHINVSCGDHQEEFLLEVTPSGDPRISCCIEDAELWIEPRELTNSLRNISAVLAKAADLYDRFVNDLTLMTRRGQAADGEV